MRRAFGALRGVSVIELHGWWRSVTNREADSRSLTLTLTQTQTQTLTLT